MARTFRNQKRNELKKIKGFNKKDVRVNRKNIRNQIKKVIQQTSIDADYDEWE